MGYQVTPTIESRFAMPSNAHARRTHGWQVKSFYDTHTRSHARRLVHWDFSPCREPYNNSYKLSCARLINILFGLRLLLCRRAHGHRRPNKTLSPGARARACTHARTQALALQHARTKCTHARHSTNRNRTRDRRRRRRRRSIAVVVDRCAITALWSRVHRSDTEDNPLPGCVPVITPAGL